MGEDSRQSEKALMKSRVWQRVQKVMEKSRVWWKTLEGVRSFWCSQEGSRVMNL